MSECKHSNVKVYDGEHRCMKCFVRFVPKYQLNEATSQLNYIRSELASMLKDEYDNYAPDSPPISLDQFMDTLKELVNDPSPAHII